MNLANKTYWIIWDGNNDKFWLHTLSIVRGYGIAVGLKAFRVKNERELFEVGGLKSIKVKIVPVKEIEP